MTLTTRIEQAGPGEQRELLEAEMRQCARDSGWPDEFYFGLAAIIRAGGKE